MEKITKNSKKLRESKKCYNIFVFFFIALVNFKTTGVILVGSVAKESFYDVIYLNKFLPYGHFLEVQKICVTVFFFLM